MRRLYYSIKALTPLHVGVGAGLGHIDLPIQREVHTKFPMIPGSSVKGALREYKIRKIAKDINDKIPNNEIKSQIMKKLDECLSACGEGEKCPDIEINGISFRQKVKDELLDLFGCQDQAGRLAFSDLRILLFPVKSLSGVFAYVTGPRVLERLAEDLGGNSKEVKLDDGSEVNIKELKEKVRTIKEMFDKDDKALIVKDSKVKINNLVVLEEFAFSVAKEFEKDDAYLKFLFDILGISFDEIRERLVIVSDNAFNDFVQNYTEVQTHIKIDPATGTVQTGALWTEEYLPAETYMYGIIFQTRNDGNNAGDLFEGLLPNYLHLGGDITTGKGFVRINWSEKGIIDNNQEGKNDVQNA